MPGLDRKALKLLDPDTAIQNIKLDVRSDFILAPHFNAIYNRAADDLWTMVESSLRSGTYEPSLPITMNVPKAHWFSRPGSILYPADRLLYQMIIDQLNPELEASIDRSRSFSHLSSDDPNELFRPSGVAWEEFQKKVGLICEQSRYVVKADISHYFERLPQHHLVNLITGVTSDSPFINLLEELLLAYQERNSYGIIQGLFPSDVLGNFYLTELDAYCDLSDLPSARYVDDLYIGFPSRKAAQQGLMSLVERLRKDGLHLNEGKSKIYKSEDLVWEETAVDRLFNEVRDTIDGERDDWDSSPYGFEVDWESEEDDTDSDNADLDVEVATVVRLLAATKEYPESVDQIERFCLPILSSAGSDQGADYVLANIARRPQQARLYFSYLASYAPASQEITEHLEKLVLDDKIATDHQKLFLIGALLKSRYVTQRMINRSLAWLANAAVSKETRAMAAIFAARRGNANQRRTVRTHYEAEGTDYVRSAILYSSKYFEAAERRTCKRAWAGHSSLNSLISKTI